MEVRQGRHLDDVHILDIHHIWDIRRIWDTRHFQEDMRHIIEKTHTFKHNKRLMNHENQSLFPFYV